MQAQVESLTPAAETMHFELHTYVHTPILSLALTTIPLIRAHAQTVA